MWDGILYNSSMPALTRGGDITASSKSDKQASLHASIPDEDDNEESGTC